MPWNDWQFYVVTAAALWGAWTVVRQLLPRRESSTPACGACASGAAACAKKPRGDEDSKLVVLETRR